MCRPLKVLLVVVGCLAADLRDVVVEARMSDPEVLREQFPLLDERAVEVARR